MLFPYVGQGGHGVDAGELFGRGVGAELGGRGGKPVIEPRGLQIALPSVSDKDGRGATGKETRTYRTLPNDREVRHTIIRVITEHLRDTATTSWQGHDFDFTRAVFDGGDFNGAHFTGGRVSFDGAEFSGGRVSFADAEFSGGRVSFDGARFSGSRVLFVEARFSGSRVSFIEARFAGGVVVFVRAEFHGGEVSFASGLSGN